MRTCVPDCLCHADAATDWEIETALADPPEHVGPRVVIALAIEDLRRLDKVAGVKGVALTDAARAILQSYLRRPPRPTPRDE